MNRKELALAVCTLGIVVAAASPLAHHRWAIDSTRSITLQGRVTGFNWSNPHVQIFLDVTNTSGQVEKWTAGGPSPSRMAGTGWDRNTLKAGDRVTAVGHLATDTENLLRIQKVVLSDGRELAGYGGR